MDDNTKLVLFNEYCPKCKRSDKDETDDICNECLHIPARDASHKPEKFEEK